VLAPLAMPPSSRRTEPVTAPEPHPEPSSSEPESARRGRRDLTPLVGPAGRVCTDLLALADPAGRILEANGAWEEVLGLCNDTLVGARWVDVIRPADRERAVQAQRQARESGTVQAFRGLCQTPSGATKWLIWRVLALPSGVEWIGAQDITDRVSREHRLAEGEGLFRHLADNVKEVFWITEPGPDSVRYVNPAYERVFGRGADELYDQPSLWWEAVHPDDRARVLRAVREREVEGTYDEVYRIVRPDGDVRWVRDRAFPVRDERGRIARIFGLAEDVTSLKRAEETLRETEERLLQSQKLEALGRLAGGIAHDFNNLLTVILGYTTLLIDAKPERDPDRETLETVRKTAERAGDLTQRLLAFSRSQVLSPKVVDLRAVVADMEPMLRRIVGEDVHLVVESPARPCLACVDPSRVGQVLMNLVVNGRDAMPSGGMLEVGLDVLEVSADWVASHPGARPGAYAVLRVKDSGVGMDASTMTRIFEPFFTTKQPGRGTGLGLSTVYGIVKQSDGQVDVESRPGEGSTFRVFLPCASGPAPDASAAPSPESLQGTETILLVEDQSEVRSFAADVLRSNGYRVIAAGSGQEALEICRDRGPAGVDLLLTDVVMPEMGGRVLWDRARVRCPAMRVLFMSGYTEDAILRHGIATNEVTLLAKPFAPHDLLRKIRAVLDA
jgi:PAS domain S-box-containing protein